MKLLAFAASLRKGSLNRQLLGYAAEVVRAKGHDVDLAEFVEFDMPLYNADLQESSGLPAGAEELASRIRGSDGLIIASPEYNYSTPGILKNAIDWLSRMDPVPLRGCAVTLLSASRSLVGGNRGLWATRIPLEFCGAWIHPDMFSLAQAHQAYDDGALKDAALGDRFDAMIDDFLSVAAALNGR